MPTQTLLSVDRERVSAAPGASVELAVRVQNLTSLLDQVALRLEGIDPTWVQVIPPYLPVFAQGQASARVILGPPRDPVQALAGLYALQVRATSRVNPGQEGEADAELEIQLDGEYQFLLGQGEGHAGETNYSLAVKNSANAPLKLHFSARDPQEALWYRFDPFEVLVPAGQQVYAILTVKPKRAADGERTIVFSVAAGGAYELRGGASVPAPARETSSHFTQLPQSALRVALQPSQITDTVPAQYEVLVSNPGMLPLTVRLVAQDPAGNLDLRCNPPQLALAPQSNGHATLVVYPRGAPTTGQRLVRSFRVTAQPVEDGVPPASAEAAFVQTGTAIAVKPRLPWVGIAIVALALLLVFVVLILLTQR